MEQLEYSINSEKKRWFEHGAIDIKLSPEAPSTDYTWLKFAARLRNNKNKVYLTAKQLVILLSMDDNYSYSLNEINSNREKNINRINSDFNVSMKTTPISRQIFESTMKKINVIFGTNLFKKCNDGRWRLLSQKEKILY